MTLIRKHPLISEVMLFVVFIASSSIAQIAIKKPRPTSQKAKVCAACIRAHEEFLASDALNGRGDGTHDELVAATYIGSQLRQYGIAPAGDDGGYVQRVETIQNKLSGPPLLKSGASPDTFTYGKDFVVYYMGSVHRSGPLQKLEAGSKVEVKSGAVVLLTGNDPGKVRKQSFGVASAGAAVVLVPGPTQEKIEAAGKVLPQIPLQLAGTKSGLGEEFAVIGLSADALAKINALPEATEITFDSPLAEPEKGSTYNAVGILRGSVPSRGALLLSAHLDHMGVGPEVNGDKIYNGADDDASGVTAVLELARVLGSKPRPHRTVIFALFGSEESGGLGSTYFREHSPVPLKDIAANLEFEMIGRPDPAVSAKSLWLTGWERSNLGPTLVAHGANLVKDPHPEQDFFARSDNYVLAKQGVVAQTISSYGLHKDYHQPSDDVAHLDFAHMNEAIGSLLGPVEWLANSSFKPEWKKGGKP